MIPLAIRESFRLERMEHVSNPKMARQQTYQYQSHKSLSRRSTDERTAKNTKSAEKAALKKASKNDYQVTEKPFTSRTLPRVIKKILKEEDQ